MRPFFGSHCGFTVACLSMLHDIAGGQTLHSLIVPSDVGEHDCAQLHFAHLPADSLTLFDRGYPGHWLFALLQQQLRHFLMRLPSGFNAQVKQRLRSGQVEDTLLFAASHPEALLFCQEAGVDPAGRVELRLVRVELASGESEVLLTSLLDRQAFPAEELADISRPRWGIETDYRQADPAPRQLQRPQRDSAEARLSCRTTTEEPRAANEPSAATGHRTATQESQAALPGHLTPRSGEHPRLNECPDSFDYFT
jgi:hypothetical protein